MGLQRWRMESGAPTSDGTGNAYWAADVDALLSRIRAVSDDIRYATDHEAWGWVSEASDTLNDLLTEGGA